jgi:hypothetical protein
MHFSLCDVAACFDDLKPAHILDGFVRALDGLLHGILHGEGGSAGEFNEFIDGVFHAHFWPERDCKNPTE